MRLNLRAMSKLYCQSVTSLCPVSSWLTTAWANLAICFVLAHLNHFMLCHFGDKQMNFIG